MDIDMNIDIDVCVCASDLFPLLDCATMHLYLDIV